LIKKVEAINCDKSQTKKTSETKLGGKTKEIKLLLVAADDGGGRAMVVLKAS